MDTFETSYPMGGTNPEKEPVQIKVNVGFEPDVKIKVIRSSRNGGSKLILVAENKIIGRYAYDYAANGLGYYFQMAIDTTVGLNLFLEEKGIGIGLYPDQFNQVMKICRDKCENRFGSRVGRQGYDALITLTA